MSESKVSYNNEELMFENKPYELFCGDSLEVLKNLPENSIDSIVTDPPYGLSFMGKKWDYQVPSIDIWKEVFRVLKPGGHLLAFAGTRTQHRMAVNIEDAGFEIRDMIAWVYGSGFPKALDISKAIGNQFGLEREVVGEKIRLGDSIAYPTNPKPDEHSPLVLIDKGGVSNTNGFDTLPASPDAIKWDGWKSALKPAMEPITLARKPLDGTIVNTVLTYGVGGLNIDGCRIGIDPTIDDPRLGGNGSWNHKENEFFVGLSTTNGSSSQGRYPGNLIIDDSEDVSELFPETKSGTLSAHHNQDSAPGNGFTMGKMERVITEFRGDSGSASRFFYVAKPSKQDRSEGLETPNGHPTVKPTELMRYLVRLITPKGGVVLDPFNGSGSTGKACMYEGMKYIGVELDQNYIDLSTKRIEFALTNPVIPEAVSPKEAKTKTKTRNKFVVE